MTRVFLIVALLALLARFEAIAHHQGEHGKPKPETVAGQQNGQ